MFSSTPQLKFFNFCGYRAPSLYVPTAHVSVSTIEVILENSKKCREIKQTKRVYTQRTNQNIERLLFRGKQKDMRWGDEKVFPLHQNNPTALTTTAITERTVLGENTGVPASPELLREPLLLLPLLTLALLLPDTELAEAAATTVLDTAPLEKSLFWVKFVALLLVFPFQQ